MGWSIAAPRLTTLHAVAASTRLPTIAPPTMSLTTPASDDQVTALVEETKTSKAVVVLYFCQSPMFSLSHTVVERTAGQYATSTLYGGAPLAVVQVDADDPVTGAICTARGVSAFPTIQVWSGGDAVEVAAADLDAKLSSLGCAKSAGSFDTTNFGGTATFESDKGTGKPSATAVDEIDFSGGRALGSTRDGKRGIPNSGARSTRDFFPGRGLDEKPGDNMNDDGTPGGPDPKKRTDKPMGY